MEIQLPVISDIDIHLRPVAFIIPDLLATHTDGKKPSQQFYFRHGIFELGEQFPALDGVSDRASQRGAGDYAFQEIVLCPFVDRLDRKIIIVVPGQDNDRDVGCLSMDRFKGLDAQRSIREHEVQQNDVTADAFQASDRQQASDESHCI
jgi:hypothetical protein